MQALHEVLSIIREHSNFDAQHLPPLQPSICDSWSDEKILEIFRKARSPEGPGSILNGEECGAVWVICHDTIVKHTRQPYTASLGPSTEYLALCFILQHTSIPVPRVRRLFAYKGYQYIVMEKIDGAPLHEVWPSLTPSQRFGVALTLQDYIRQLRQASAHYARRSCPGPMGPTPRKCLDATWLFDRDRPCGPFESQAKLLGHWNAWFDLPKRNARGSPESTKLVESHPLVLTHGDLSPRNILVGHDGRLWVVDWEWSGFYPPWCEYIMAASAALNDAMPRGWMVQPGTRQAAQSWWNYIPFITGTWPLESRLLLLEGYPALPPEGKI
ncbi:hypothetical protein CVT26_011019 [Gymnopilus dilepis]|uniref:Aminoglycoside phosphotransferase domain-containing protein n=1 Tax=Gymnopilus dilepis TaxID=231916 RepID=A0A409VY75_9AGAR|nr:hypothetical protein CVT26_011019 [Gymnopilus dilepis]